MLRNLFILLVLGHLLGIGFYFHSAQEAFFVQRMVPEQKRAFEIHKGTGLNDVLQRLFEADLAPHPIHSRLALFLNKHHLVIKKGRYALPEQASTFELLELFDQGRVKLHKLTVPEGLDKWQTAAHLASQGWGEEDVFLELINDPRLIRHIDSAATDLEGYLFPETYLFPEKTSPETIVQTMVSLFLEKTEDLRQRLPERGLTLRQWVSLATLVEKESSIPEEGPTIAGVFQNRLNKGMLLQCDPTIIYSLKNDGLYRGKIYKSQILYDHAYNTYVYKCLPPGPIANPGMRALQAAFEPAQTPYYYFVANGTGSHDFSKTLAEHNRAVRRMRQRK